MDGLIQERVIMLKFIRSCGTGAFVLYIGWTLFMLFLTGGHITPAHLTHVIGLMLTFWVWTTCAYLVYPAAQKMVSMYGKARKLVTQRVTNRYLPSRMVKPVRKEDSQALNPIKPQEVFQ